MLICSSLASSLFFPILEILKYNTELCHSCIGPKVLCISVNGKKNVWGRKHLNVFPVRMLHSVMAPWGSGIIPIHHTDDRHPSLPSLHITLFCSWIKYQSRVCLQNWGVEKYCCVDTWAVSLPPTPTLTLDASGCLPPFEMLIDLQKLKTFFLLYATSFCPQPRLSHGPHYNCITFP